LTRSVPASLVLGMIRFYQVFLSPLLGRNCRFEPTCSAYTFEAVERYGFFKGIGLGAKRILRCGPWTSGGFDPVPDLKATPQCERKKTEA
jgi:putative membrane protein insertion efficiency factor